MKCQPTPDPSLEHVAGVDPLVSVSQTDRWARIVISAYLIVVFLVLAFTWRGLPEYVWATEYYMDDWEWVRQGSSNAQFADHVFHLTGIVRPAFHMLYWLAYPLSGFDARLLAVSLAVVWWGTALACVRMFQLAGFALHVAVLGVVISLPFGPSTDAFFQVSYHGLTVSRLMLAATCIAFLGGNPRGRVWLPLTIVGFLTHEQYVATAPILLSMLVWRDGIGSSMARALSPGPLRAFLIAFVGLATLRGILFIAVEQGGTHALALSHLAGSLAPIGIAINAFEPGGPSFATGPVLLGLMAVNLRELPAVMILSAAICGFGYAPFLLQGEYIATYFANLLVLGLGILFAWMALGGVDADLRAGTRRRTVRALALLVLTLFWVGTPPRLALRLAQGVTRQLDEVLSPVLGTQPGVGPVQVVFVEDGTDADRPPPAYLTAIGLVQGRSDFFSARWPNLRFQFERTTTTDLPHRDSDSCRVELRVSAAESQSAPWAIRMLRHSGCSGGEQRL